MSLLDRRLSRLSRAWRTAIDWLLTIVVAVAAVLAFEAEVAQPYRIPSSSMEPTLHCARPGAGCEAQLSDRVIACKVCYRFGSPSRGQIVVFNAPAAAAAPAPAGCDQGGVYVKRLIGLPGDTVHEDSQSNIWVNGKRLSEPYISAAVRAADTYYRGDTWHVPRGDYFMLGDNRGDSCDSRVWGDVPRKSLIGPVVMTYFPLTRISFR